MICCGSQVYDVQDPRHVGRVEAIISAGQKSVATIKWNKDGAYSRRIPLARLRLVQNSDPSEHNFTGNLEDWDDRVFLNASNFRVFRWVGTRREELKMTSFAEAMVRADDELKRTRNARVLVYAITESGRYVCLPRKRWNHYATLWLAKHKRREAKVK